MKQIAQELADRRKDVPLIEKISWYYRHWKDSGDDAKEGLKNKEKLPRSFIDDSEWNNWMLDDVRNPVSQKAKNAKEEERQKLKEQKRLQKEQDKQNKVDEESKAI